MRLFRYKSLLLGLALSGIVALASAEMVNVGQAAYGLAIGALGLGSLVSVSHFLIRRRLSKAWTLGSKLLEETRALRREVNTVAHRVHDDSVAARSLEGRLMDRASGQELLTEVDNLRIEIQRVFAKVSILDEAANESMRQMRLLQSMVMDVLVAADWHIDEISLPCDLTNVDPKQ